jgi:hypothetical protein
MTRRMAIGLALVVAGCGTDTLAPMALGGVPGGADAGSDAAADGSRTGEPLDAGVDATYGSGVDASKDATAALDGTTRSSPDVDVAPSDAAHDVGHDGSGSDSAAEVGSVDAADAAPFTPLVTDAPPESASYTIDVAGQTAWVHDDGVAGGYFHTYDGLQVAGPTDEPRTVHVFLPRGYGTTAQTYPVLYMNDGDTAFWPGGAYSKTWNAQYVISSMYAAGTLRDIIVVAVAPLDRNAEYTHVFWQDGEDCCGLAQYTTYISDYVKPFFDANYRTKADAADNAILGSSHGGLASFYIAGTRPDRFGKAAAMSPSFWAGLDFGSLSAETLIGSALLEATAPVLSDPARRPLLWIDWGMVRTGGTQNSVIEMLATARGSEMVSLLESSYGYVDQGDVHWEQDPNGQHDEESWSARLPNVLGVLFGP